MDTSRPQEPTPANTTNAHILSGIEALLFVLVGVVAVRLPVLALVPVLLAIIGALLLIRWMNAAPARTHEATAYLWRRYEQRGLLLGDVQQILGHEREEHWRYRDLVVAIRWWFDEDLLSEWMADQEIERQEKHGAKVAARMVRRSWRSRLRGWRFEVKRRLEGAMTQRPLLIDAVYRANYDEVARIILTRAIAEGFVCEHLEHPSRLHAEITYSLNAELLRAPAASDSLQVEGRVPVTKVSRL